jgi:hypothetical protein
MRNSDSETMKVEERARVSARRQSHSFCKAQIRPPVPISRGRTMIFDIVAHIVMEWTMPNESRICRSLS